jgi:S-adenosylmethionine:tRNA ribosyltransferase-isomerase
VQTSDFEYDLPLEAIAQSAVEPRDASRLLRVAGMTDHRFSELPTMLRRGDLLVVNRTRVRRARLLGTRSGTGGSVELLLLRPLAGGRWEGLVRPARRLRPGVELEFGAMRARIVNEPEAGRVEVDLEASGDIEDVVAAIGIMPLPPYFHGTLEDPERYQTMFAQVTGSAAAPTAALHFTPGLVERLAVEGVNVTTVELDVGLDTFRPMDEGPLADHTMHTERYFVPEAAVDAIDATRGQMGRVVAVGTTVMRTLETAASIAGQVTPGEGTSSLFVKPGYRPRVVDALLTNFHAPGTTLIVLVASLLGPQWRDVYDAALERGYRFLSFGDAMLIEDLQLEDLLIEDFSGTTP